MYRNLDSGIVKSCPLLLSGDEFSIMVNLSVQHQLPAFHNSAVEYAIFSNEQEYVGSIVLQRMSEVRNGDQEGHNHFRELRCAP